MNQWIVPLIAFALITTLGYFQGRKKNRWISGWIARESEEALKPVDTQYTNFGGTIGYNFIYKLKKPFQEAKGTFTLLPRQSILYLPISFLITKHDRYYMNLFIQGKLLGEGHIVSSTYERKARRTIHGVESMASEEVYKNNRRYILFWKEQGMGERLRNFLEKIAHEELLYHFCCYGENKTFFFYIKPERGKLEELLKSALPELKPFFIKGAGTDD
ncbi:MAG: hypothetical protein N2442_06450 [Spirochaetes bacterium]|nr:hypothetical protein [Spirochaetota bacterium]